MEDLAVRKGLQGLEHGEPRRAGRRSLLCVCIPSGCGGAGRWQSAWSEDVTRPLLGLVGLWFKGMWLSACGDHRRVPSQGLTARLTAFTLPWLVYGWQLQRFCAEPGGGRWSKFHSSTAMCRVEPLNLLEMPPGRDAAGACEGCERTAPGQEPQAARSGQLVGTGVQVIK